MEKRDVSEGAESVAGQVQEAARRGVQQTAGLSKQVIDLWANSTEGALKAAFDLQNAVINAGRSLTGPEGTPNQALYKQWADSVHTAQQATLNALDATKRLTRQLAPDKPEGEGG
jgi:hypothetical protein